MHFDPMAADEGLPPRIETVIRVMVALPPESGANMSLPGAPEVPGNPVLGRGRVWIQKPISPGVVPPRTNNTKTAQDDGFDLATAGLYVARNAGS